MANIVEIVLGARDDSKSAVQSYTNGIKEIESRIEELKSVQADAAKTMLSQGTANQTYRTAQDDLRKSSDDLKATQKELKESTDALGNSQDAASTSGKGLFTTFTAANLAATAITRGIDLLRTQLSASISAANQYQSSMAGLSSYAVAFGSSAAAAQQSARSLSSDGLLPIANSANALKSILSTGLGLDEATQLVETFKDRAAFGRNASIDFGTAVENLGQTFKTEQSHLGDASGMTENYSQILEVGAAQMGKNVDQLSSLERAQAKYLGILQLSSATQGDANRYAETASGQQAKLAYSVNQTQVAIGTALQPSVSLLSQAFVDLTGSLGFTDSQMQTTQGNIVTLSATAAEAVNQIIGLGRVFFSVFQAVAQGSVQPINDAINTTSQQSQKIWDNWGKQIENIANGTASAQVDANQKALDTMSAAQTQAAKKMSEDIARENRDYADAIQKRTRDFQRSMQDMIIDHRDKSRSIQADINAENAAYAKQAAQLKANFDEALGDLDSSHADKVADIEQQMADERAKGYSLDGVAYTEVNQKKIDDLQKSLDKENATYQKARDKKVAAYNQDVADAQTSHDEKLANLQTELQKELDVLKLHAAEVAAVGEATKLDDISRLRRQYAEENAEAAKQHAQRIADIRKQGSETGAAYGSSYASQVGQGAQAAKNAINQANTDILTNAANQGKSAGNSWISGFAQAMDNFSKNTSWGRIVQEVSKWQEQAVRSVASFFGLDANAAARLFTGRATGGVTRPGEMTLVGEKGPEIAQFPAGTRIIPTDQTQKLLSQQSGGQANTVNIYNPTYNTISDAKGLVRDIGFRLSLT